MKLKWPTDASQAAHMRDMQQRNKVQCLTSRAESWMKAKLERYTKHKWKRQATWGYRVFDFWCHALGIAVEVDGAEHRRDWDDIRDDHNYKTSGILVLRIRNFNEADAKDALESIWNARTWNERRESLGLNPITT